MKKCDVIIPIYNSPDWLALCVEAAERSDLSKCIGNIYLVNDCSNNETVKCIYELKNKYTNIIVLKNTQNLGFVKTCNKGLKETKEDFIMLLNSDCLLAEDTTAKLLRQMEADEEIGLICPLSNNAANLSIDLPSKLDYIKMDKLLRSYFLGKNFEACTIVGNCMVISRKCYDKIGGLDESYGFGYGEETDYQFRAQEVGFKALVAIDTYVFHKSQVSFGDSELLNQQKQKNRALFFSRWGDQYKKLLDQYNLNDPVQYVLGNLSKYSYESVENFQSVIFDKDYLDRVAALDNKYSLIQLEKLVKNKSESDIMRKVKRIGSLSQKALNVYHDEGMQSMLHRTAHFVANRFVRRPVLNNQLYYSPGPTILCYMNDLLIVICNNDQTEIAFRAYTIKEQLSYYGIFSDIITKSDFNINMLKAYRGILLIGELATDLYKTELSQKCLSQNKALFLEAVSYHTFFDSKIVKGIIVPDKQHSVPWISNGFTVCINDSVIPDSSLPDTVKNRLEIPEQSTARKGQFLAEFIKKAFSPNCAIVLPHVNPSGGIHIALKHCEILQSFGYDAFIINLSESEESMFSEGREVYVINGQITGFHCEIERMVATMWHTLDYIDKVQVKGKKYYLVQSFETAFYGLNQTVERQHANSTYVRDNVRYITVSKWCENWLEQQFKRKVYFVHNGLSNNLFRYRERDFSKKIRILIEGNCESFFKNMNESFLITNQLDPNRYEVIFMPNYGTPKLWYKYSEIHEKVPYEQVCEIYSNCHILLKTSLLESFSYPPLEMMATGGTVVAVQNQGNREYMIDGYNCAIYPQGDIDAAIAQIEKIVNDCTFRETLIKNGLKTASERCWSNYLEEIKNAYE